MNWFFANNNSLVERETGFTLYLDSGDWATPQEITPVPPPSLNKLEAAKLVRVGLAFAREVSQASLKAS